MNLAYFIDPVLSNPAYGIAGLVIVVAAYFVIQEMI